MNVKSKNPLLCSKIFTCNVVEVTCVTERDLNELKTFLFVVREARFEEHRVHSELCI